MIFLLVGICVAVAVFAYDSSQENKRQIEITKVMNDYNRQVIELLAKEMDKPKN